MILNTQMLFKIKIVNTYQSSRKKNSLFHLINNMSPSKYHKAYRRINSAYPVHTSTILESSHFTRHSWRPNLTSFHTSPIRGWYFLVQQTGKKISVCGRRVFPRVERGYKVASESVLHVVFWSIRTYGAAALS